MHDKFGTVWHKMRIYALKCSAEITVYQSTQNLCKRVKYSLRNSRKWLHLSRKVHRRTNSQLTAGYWQNGWLVSRVCSVSRVCLSALGGHISATGRPIDFVFGMRQRAARPENVCLSACLCSEISCNVKWNVYLAMEIPDCVSFISG